MINLKALPKICLIFLTVTVLFLMAYTTAAQIDPVEKKRLKNPAAVKGFIGGEAHDSYVTRVRKNQTLRVRISWTGRGDRRAHFVVSRSPNFYAGDLVRGGTETHDGKNWAGKVPATGDYYIYVTAHPDARYTLNVSVK